MKVLYIGDIMGEPGVKIVERLLPDLRASQQIDLVIAQAENVTNGKGIIPADFERLRKAGVDFGTGGNWSTHEAAIFPLLNDPQQPIIRPANYSDDTPGLGYKYAQTTKGPVLIISLLGQIVGRDAAKPVDNPLQTIDRVLLSQQDTPKVAVVVNFHGDFSSEKLVIGRYLDGHAALVVGDHWHIPTADAMVLPRGTAHITDVGMCGTVDSCLGVKLDIIIDRWKTGQQSRNILEDKGPLQFNAVLVDVNEQTGLASSIIPVRKIIDDHPH